MPRSVLQNPTEETSLEFELDLQISFYDSRIISLPAYSIKIYLYKKKKNFWKKNNVNIHDGSHNE